MILDKEALTEFDVHLILDNYSFTPIGHEEAALLGDSLDPSIQRGGTPVDLCCK